jgi:2-aminoadipate transaminase
MGGVASPPELTPLFVNAREVNDVTGEAMSQRIVHLAAQDFLDDHIVRFRSAYRERAELLLSVLHETLPADVRVFEPEGGFFVWVELPEGTDAEELVPYAAEAGVTFLPGGWFFPDRRPHQAIRLSFANASLDDLREGGRRLGAAVNAFLASRTA